MKQTLLEIRAELEKQNKLLESVLHGLAGPPPIDYYKLYLQKCEDSLPEFAEWRYKISTHAKSIAEGIRQVIEEYREIGFLEPPGVTARELELSLAQPDADFNPASFVRFEGPAIGDLRLYMPGTALEIKTPPTYSIWGNIVRRGDLVEQKITASNIDYVEPDRLPPLHYWQTDLIYNAYRKDLGMVSWSGFFRNHNDQLRSIGYELDGHLMWINELITPEITGRHILENGDREFVISIDYVTEEKDRRDKTAQVFNVFAFHTIFNFKTGRVRAMRPDEGPRAPAVPEPRVLQMRNVLVSLGEIGRPAGKVVGEEDAMTAGDLP